MIDAYTRLLHCCAYVIIRNPNIRARSILLTNNVVAVTKTWLDSLKGTVNSNHSSSVIEVSLIMDLVGNGDPCPIPRQRPDWRLIRAGLARSRSLRAAMSLV